MPPKASKGLQKPAPPNGDSVTISQKRPRKRTPFPVAESPSAASATAEVSAKASNMTSVFRSGQSLNTVLKALPQDELPDVITEESLEVWEPELLKELLGDAGSDRRPPTTLIDLDAKLWLESHSQGAYAKRTSGDEERASRFRSNVTEIISRLCKEATHHIRNSKTLELDERSMNVFFAAYLGRADPKKLSDRVLAGIPYSAQVVLGKADLTPDDLLSLPDPGISRFQHQAVYINVATSRSASNESQSSPSGVYVGSTTAKPGGWTRLHTHRRLIQKNNGPCDRHYDWCRLRGVETNFRLVMVQQNPWAYNGYASEGNQDLHRWHVVLLEAVLMILFDLLEERNDYMTNRAKKLFGSIRDQLSLPSFRDFSLNRAFPLLQGTAGGMVRAPYCGNRQCLRPLRPYKVKPDDYREASNCVFDRKLQVVLCTACLRRTEGNDLRSRVGSVSGYFERELTMERVNAVWIEKHGRQCTTCSVAIDDEATLYGIAAGIMCRRCHLYSMKNGSEYAPKEVIDGFFPCEACKKDCHGVYEWETPSGVEKICTACYQRRCSFGKDVASRSGVDHYAKCGNAGCPGLRVQQAKVLPSVFNVRYYVEDTISGKWRCASCDWVYSNYGREHVKGQCFEYPDDLTSEPKPIAHHRFNYTTCVDCGNYATPTIWYHQSDGTYKCGMCQVCANDQCHSKEFVPSHRDLVPDPALGGHFCRTCFTSNAKRTAEGQPRLKNFPRGNLTNTMNGMMSLKIRSESADAASEATATQRPCENCGTTKNMKWAAMCKGRFGCDSCNGWLRRWGMEYPNKPAEDIKVCLEEGCGANSEDGITMKFYQDIKLEGKLYRCPVHYKTFRSDKANFVASSKKRKAPEEAPKPE